MSYDDDDGDDVDGDGVVDDDDDDVDAGGVDDDDDDDVDAGGVGDDDDLFRWMKVTWYPHVATIQRNNCKKTFGVIATINT